MVFFGGELEVEGVGGDRGVGPWGGEGIMVYACVDLLGFILYLNGHVATSR